jgi:hypothetical protein
MITIPFTKTAFGTRFGIARTLTGTYVCPGWHLVPDGTKIEDVQFAYTEPEKVVIEKVVVEQTEWKVPGSKPGVVYLVNRYPDGDWTCSCLAKAFKRGDCKHIIALKK